MRADERRVDHGIFIVAIGCQHLENPLPHAAAAPAHVSRVDHPEIAKPLGKIAPGNARSVAIEHRLNKQSIVPRRLANMLLSTRQQILDPVPLVVPQPVTLYHLPASSS